MSERTDGRRTIGRSAVLVIVFVLVALVVPPIAGAAGPHPGGLHQVGWSPVQPGQESPFEGPMDRKTAGEGIPDPSVLEALAPPVGKAETHRAPAAMEAVAVEIPSPTTIDMKVLIIHTNWEEEFEVKGITGTLDRIGIRYDTLNAESEDLTRGRLFDETGHGNYYAVILTTGNLLYESGGSYHYGFDQTEWDLLWAYEAAFGVRQVTSYTAPWGFPDTYGLNLVGDMDTTNVPLNVTLTPAGEDVFSYLTGAPIPIRYAWVYLATVADPATVAPLIVSGDHAIASVKTYPDGRENLAVTVAKNDWALHSLLLWGGMVDWVTRGFYLGERHVNFDAQVDDLLIDDDLWDPEEMSDETGLSYRMSGADFEATIAWQNTLRAHHPVAADVRLEMAFNGEGATGIYEPDTLTPAVIAHESAFSWVNHSYSHLNMDSPTTYAEAKSEIKTNDRIAKRTLLLETYVKSSFVQPDISGLENPHFLQAAADNRIKYLISDTSREGWSNPTPNTGIILPEEKRLLVIPRRPSNLFYNLSTPAEWVSEYNCYYGPNATCAGGEWSYWDHDLSYAEIVDVESEMLLSYLLKWDIDPLMFHQANLRDYGDGESLLGDLLDATFDKYAIYYTLPVRGLTQAEIGAAMLAHMAYEAVDLTAEIIPCTRITLVSSKSVTVPVTGLTSGGKVEAYGDQTIVYVKLKPDRPKNIGISCGS